MPNPSIETINVRGDVYDVVDTTARTTATNAATAASNAQTTATNAATAAGNAQTTANNALTAANNAQGMIATVEATSTASKEYSVGDLLIYNETLYRVTAKIASGGTITVGTNAVATNVGTHFSSYSKDNLIDNACFYRFIINQRGESSYVGGSSTSPKYGIDRWYGANSATSIVVNANSITYSGANGRWWQKLEHALPSDIYTLSALVKATKANTFYVRAMSGSTELFGTTVSVINSWNLMSVTGTGSPDGVLALITSAGGSVEIKAIKLEPGPIQTLARQYNGEWLLNDAPNYQQELAKCQRYQLMIKPSVAFLGIGGVSVQNSASANVQIPIPVPLAKDPKVTYSGTWTMRYGASNTAIDGVTFEETGTACAGVAWVQALPPSGSSFTVGSYYNLQVKNGTAVTAGTYLLLDSNL